MDCLGVPFLDGGWYSIHGHDTSHKREKYPIRMLGSLMLAWATWLWNSQTYWFRGGEYVQSFLRIIHLVVSQAIAVLVTSLYLKSLLNFAIKFGYVPRVTVLVVLTAFSWNVAAQVRADLLVI